MIWIFLAFLLSPAEDEWPWPDDETIVAAVENTTRTIVNRRVK